MNPLTVAIIPDMRSINPYQDLLAAALERRGVVVRFPEQFGGKRPMLRALVSGQFDALHLDWIHPYVTAPTLSRSLMLSAKFVSKLLLARLLGRRIVWTVHNVTSHDARFGRLERTVSSLIAALSHTLAVHFPAARQIVRNSLRVSGRKEITVARHGHYIDAYGSGSSRLSDETQHNTSRPLVFLAFGLVRPYKRLEELIAAFRLLDREDVRLSVRGMPGDEEYASRLLRLSEEDDRVDMDLGFVEDDAVAEVFATADVIVLPQTDALTSGSLILAMSMGKPVVAARTPHAEWLLGDREGGLLYNPGDLEDLTRALQRMADRSEELAEMGSANQRAIAVHTWPKMAEKLESAYRGRTRRRGGRTSG